ncbi:MAG TPA: hypothetical protein VGS22_29140 [Thermoanaerobaculia bacterium]|jgi:hypothetical protein|nr:hypothetical protein [Thermoanaerobaculia bacterium]
MDIERHERPAAATRHGDLRRQGEVRPLVKFRTQGGRINNTGPATFAIALANESFGDLTNLFGGPPFMAGGTSTWLTPVDEAICGLVNVRGAVIGWLAFKFVV